MKNSIKILVFIAVLLGAIYFFYANKNKSYLITGNTQGTTYTIKYFSDKENISKESIDSILHLFDLELSTYIPESKISKINENDTTIVVNNWFKEVFQLSSQVYKESNGLFDPTIGILVNAYGFGPKKVEKMPTEDEVKQLLKKVGFSKVKINANNTITKEFPDMYFDFNAIAQGYAVDVLANYLKSKKIENAMVEIGGEVFAFGQNIESKKPWTIGIEDPLQEEGSRKILEKISLDKQGLATSGNYRKIKTDSITGKKYVHTLNPITGISQQSSILSATVIAPNTALADAYATTFMLMNLQDIKSFIKERKHLKVLIVSQNGAKDIEVYKN